jgi:hypothetical protein
LGKEYRSLSSSYVLIKITKIKINSTINKAIWYFQISNFNSAG